MDGQRDNLEAKIAKEIGENESEEEEVEQKQKKKGHSVLKFVFFCGGLRGAAKKRK